MEIKITGLKELIAMSERYPAIAQKHVDRAIQRSLIRIQDDAKRKAPFGTSGQLRNNWDLRSGKFEGALRSNAQSNGFYYGNAVNFGSRPHFPPVQALNLWAKRKGLNPYVVARSIARKGTKANPFFTDAVQGNEKNVDLEFDNALDAILKEL